MWRRIANWYRVWDEEQLAVLARPELAEQAPAGYRRHLARKLATMPALQRQQLLEFSMKYRGARLVWSSVWLALAFTLCGAVLHLTTTGIRWLPAIVGANLVGFMVTWALITAWFGYSRLAKQKTRLVLAVLFYTVFGAAALTGVGLLTSDSPAAHFLARWKDLLSGIAAGGLVVLVPVLAISILRSRQAEAINARLQQEAEQARLARELSESQMRLLRAQIEPHFLFNTLGAVQQLAEQGAPRAAELTANLIDFLRSSMGNMRSEEVSLKTEFSMIESYLKVMQVRLGQRLRFSLALPRALEPVRLPSMILLTLVENAIKHGIEPALRGGEVSVAAEQQGAGVRIRVQDTGVGMSTVDEPDFGGGTGLDNVRRRLRLAYGEEASLLLHDGDPGLVAEVTIPHKQA